MRYDNLWDIPSNSEDILSSDNVFEIMRQQGQYLKESSEQKIYGKFCKIKTINPLSTMGIVLSAFATKEVLQNDETDTLKDAGDWYKSQKYGFEIYNKSYKFRVLEMIITPVYPIHLIIDEGVTENIQEEIIACAEKSNINSHYLVNSDDQLLECLKLIFTSKKVRYILYRMKQEAITDDPKYT